MSVDADPRRLLLITQCDARSLGRGVLARLVSSLEDQQDPVTLVVVVHGQPAAPLPPTTIHVVRLDVHAPCGLARSRNLALAECRRRDLFEQHDFCAFPDDDCVFTPGSVAAVSDAFGTHPGDGFVVGRFGPSFREVDRERFPDHEVPITPGVATRAVSSNSLFLTTATVAHLGGFDERFGLGARFGSSEDTEYAIRAIKHGEHGTYVPDVVLVHPYKEGRAGRYYPGAVAAVARHAGLRAGALRTLASQLRWGVRSPEVSRRALLDAGRFAASARFGRPRRGD